MELGGLATRACWLDSLLSSTKSTWVYYAVWYSISICSLCLSLSNTANRNAVAKVAKTLQLK